MEKKEKKSEDNEPSVLKDYAKKKIHKLVDEMDDYKKLYYVLAIIEKDFKIDIQIGDITFHLPK